MEPGLGASRWSKVLGLPRMAGRLREIAEFTTDGWLQRWVLHFLLWQNQFGIQVTFATIPGEQGVKVCSSGGCIGTSQEDVCEEGLLWWVVGGGGQMGH